MASLFEQYRPQTWADVVGQDKAVKQLQTLSAKRGLGGRAIFISGQSGTGKTTIARLIAAEVADDWSIDEWDAGKLSVADLDKVEANWDMRGMGNRGRAYIVNEAHGLRKPVIRQLLVMLERIPAHCVIVFTTTVEGEQSLFEDCDDASPLLSRCLPINLARRGLSEPFAMRLMEVAKAEGLDGLPFERYVNVMKECRNNLRAAFQVVESGSMLG